MNCNCKNSHILVIFFIWSSCCTTLAAAQQRGVLNVHDSLPEFIIPNVLHSGKNTINTADFKDRLLILDFWSTHCTNCIEIMPEMHRLQKIFGSKVMILPVTDQHANEIIPFWNRNPYTKGLPLYSVVSDTQFKKWFPAIAQPHEVWIYKGKVIGITTAQYIDEYNIRRVINGERIDWVIKNDYYQYNYLKPLFDHRLVHQKDVSSFSYAAISGSKIGVNSFISDGNNEIIRDSINQQIRIYYVNKPLYRLYLSALNKAYPSELIKPFGNQSNSANQVIWEVADRSKYRFLKGREYWQEWNLHNSICVEYLVKDSGQLDMEVYRKFVKDMDRIFEVHVRWEKRKENVIVILKKSVYTVPKETQRLQSHDEITLGEIVYQLNEKEDSLYTFNESGIYSLAFKVSDIQLDNYKSLKQVLERSGLEMTMQEREVDKLIFTEM